MEKTDSNITIIKIQDIQTLRKNEKNINSFLDDPLVNSSLYHYSNYIENMMLSDDADKKWNIILIQDAGNLVSIIPIYIYNKTFPIEFALFKLYKFKIDLLRILGNCISYRSDYNLSTIHEILKQQLKTSLHFDLGIIEALPADSQLFTDFNVNSQTDFSLTPLPKDYEVVRYIKFPETWSDYLASMKRKRRYNLKRNVKIINEKFDNNVALKCYEKETDVEPFLTALDDIYKNTWQSSAFGNKSRLNNAEIKQNSALSKLGLFKSYTLTVSNTPIAFIRGYLYKGKYHYEEIGYKQDWAKYNPGSVLNYLMLQHLMEGPHGLAELNFGYGENVYKKVFSNGEYQAANAYLYKKGSKGHMIIFIQQKLNTIYDFIRNIIIKLNLEVTVRRVLRNRS